MPRSVGDRRGAAPPPVIAKSKKSPVTSETGDHRGAAAPPATHHSFREHLPTLLSSLFAVPPLNDATAFTSAAKSSGTSRSDDALIDVLKQIRSSCVTFTTGDGPSPPSAALPSIPNGYNRRESIVRRRMPRTTSEESQGAMSDGRGDPNRSSIRNANVPAKADNSSLSGLCVSPESEKIAQRIIYLQFLMFPSTFKEEVATSADALSISASVSSDDPSIANGCRQSSLQEPISKKMWKVMYRKPRSSFPLLLAACRSDLLTQDICIAASLLTLIYNLLRSAPQDSKKVVKLAVKLGLLRVCSSMLKTYSEGVSMARPPRSISPSTSLAAAPSRVSLRARICEVSGLLLGLSATYDLKVQTVARVSRGLFYLSLATEVYGSMLEQLLSQHRCLSDFDCTAASPKKSPNHIPEDCRESALLPEQKGALLSFQSFLSKTESAHSCYKHMMLSLNILSRPALNVQEIHSTSTCMKVMVAIIQFITQICPKLLRFVATPDASGLLQLTAHIEDVDHKRYAPLFMVQGLKNFETTLFWTLTLVHRMCSGPPTADSCIMEANSQHLLRALFRIVKHCGMCGKSQGAGKSGDRIYTLYHPHLASAALHAFGTVLNGDRVRGLKDLSESGSLKLLTESILHIPQPHPSQWLRYYHHLCEIYGLCFLPAPPTNTPNSPEASLNLRAPICVLQSVLKMKVECALPNCEEKAEESSPPSTPSEDGVSFDSPPLYGPLLADLHPEWFSPELAGGYVESSTQLPPLEEVTMPWNFTETPPPSTFECCTTGGFEKEASVPLCRPTEKSIINILKQQISRFLLMSGEVSDHSRNLSGRHEYEIVYERSNRKLEDPRSKSLSASLTPGLAAAKSESIFSSMPAMGSGASTEASGRPLGPGLHFESNFECGNLQRAVKVTNEEYDLVLSFDTTTNSYVQWFCFSVTNYTPGETYRFSIINMEKTSSTFNEGQRPLMLHIPDSSTKEQQRQWMRTGEEIYYFPNSFRRPPREHARKAVKETKVRGKGASQTKLTKNTSRRSTVSAKVSSSKSKSAAPQGNYSTDGESFSLPTALSQEGRYYTLTFKVKMPASGGKVYFTNCYPFSYTDLRRMIRYHAELASGQKEMHTPSFFVQTLSHSTCGIPIPMITTTALFNRATKQRYTTEEIQRRPVCFLTARVHPGETNSSWMILGLIDYLAQGCAKLAYDEVAATSSQPPTSMEGSSLEKAAGAAALLDGFVFKIIPMLNVDGVIMGNHRCSIVGMDLNRDYLNPSHEMSPVLFALKRILSSTVSVYQRHVIMAADFHGHSKAKNFLIYGCTRSTLVSAFKLKGKIALDSFVDEASGQVCTSVAPEKLLPAVLSHLCPAYDLQQSNFAIQKSKANTNRVVMYREYGIRMSYGVEASMMGGKGALCLPAPLSGASLTGSTHAFDTHYNQQTFSKFGVAFLCSLQALLTSEQNANKSAEPGEEVEENMECAAFMALAWQQLFQAGSGRSPPIEMASESSGQWLSPEKIASLMNNELPFKCHYQYGQLASAPLSHNHRREILYQLLRGCQTTVRLEDCVMDGDDEEDADGADNQPAGHEYPTNEDMSGSGESGDDPCFSDEDGLLDDDDGSVDSS